MPALVPGRPAMAVKVDPTPIPRDCCTDSSDRVGEIPLRREMLRLHSADAPFRSA